MVTTRTRSVLRAVALAVGLLVATACQADFDVVVQVEEDGSGLVETEITLDEEATAALLDLGVDSPGLPLRDLAEAGWVIGRPDEDDSGRTRITASKAFGTPAQFAAVMDELAGDDGIIRDFVLTREQSFGRVDYAVVGELDSTGGLEAFSDPELEQTLGRTVESIITAPPYNASAEDFSLSITAMLPGELQEGANTGAAAGQGLEPRGRWTLDLGTPEVVDVELRSTRRALAAQVWRGVAVVAAVAAALIAFAQLLRIAGSLRRPARTARPRPRPAESASSTSTASSPGAAGAGAPAGDVADEGPLYSVVALDGMGVLYREGDDVRKLLIPFARERGSPMAAEDIAAKARLLSLGRMTPADFWATVGVNGDPDELDAAYLARHQLMPGVVRYLRSLRDQGVRVACITNDAASWAMKLRSGHSLDALIDPWVVSGSVGVRKPDAPLFEVLRRVTGERPASILVVDDNLDALDAARELGFGTAWFTPDGDRADARGHDLLRSFDVGVEEEPPPSESATTVSG